MPSPLRVWQSDSRLGGLDDVEYCNRYDKLKTQILCWDRLFIYRNHLDEIAINWAILVKFGWNSNNLKCKISKIDSIFELHIS